MSLVPRMYTPIPPRSTGDKVQMANSVTFEYSNKTTDFEVGDIISGLTSGFVGEVCLIEALSPTTGRLWLKPDLNTLVHSIDLVEGETLQNVDLDPLCLVASDIELIYTNTFTPVSAHNPTFGQRIDEHGEAHVRFKDGPLETDAFGRLRSGGTTIIGEYTFNHNTLPQCFSSKQLNGATVDFEYLTQSLLLTNPITSGAHSCHTSNLYHHYIPGVSSNIIMTVFTGDVGKANVIRRWGYYDDNNGLFFELNGTDFYVVVRSDTSGVVVDTKIHQSDWNKDVLDGSKSINNKSKVNLNVSKNNIYWIDFQWLGAGRVRFGTQSKGERIVVHEQDHSNQLTSSYMRTASLPLKFEQINTDTSGSTSELRVNCASVIYESTIDLNSLGEPQIISSNMTLSSGIETPLLAVRQNPVFNGRQNSSVAVLHKISCSVIDTTTNLGGYVKIRIYQNAVASPTNSPASWTEISPGLSGVEYTPEPFVAWNGFAAGDFFIHGSQLITGLELDTSFQYGSIKHADNGLTNILLFTVEKLTGNNDLLINFNVLLKDVVN